MNIGVSGSIFPVPSPRDGDLFVKACQAISAQVSIYKMRFLVTEKEFL